MTHPLPAAVRSLGTLAASGALLAGAVVAGAWGTAAPAAAQTVDFPDARHDMHHPADIQRVRVHYQARTVLVRVTHRNLTPRGNKGASVYLDTDRARRGPEYVFAAGIFEGSDYQLARVRGWQPVGAPLRCRYRLLLHYRHDVSAFRIGRGCLEAPAAVRVAVKVGAERRSGGWATDWLGGRRHWTGWVHRN